MDNQTIIIIRSNLAEPTEVSLNIDEYMNSAVFNTLSQLISTVGIKNLINKIYKENIENDLLEESNLYKKYLEVINTNLENEYFKIVHKLDESLAVRITEHINIYRIVDDILINNDRLIPWYYASSEIYIADTWWEEDVDIIKDINTLPFKDFLHKYKMF